MTKNSEEKNSAPSTVTREEFLVSTVESLSGLDRNTQRSIRTQYSELAKVYEDDLAAMDENEEEESDEGVGQNCDNCGEEIKETHKSEYLDGLFCSESCLEEYEDEDEEDEDEKEDEANM